MNMVQAYSILRSPRCDSWHVRNGSFRTPICSSRLCLSHKIRGVNLLNGIGVHRDRKRIELSRFPVPPRRRGVLRRCWMERLFPRLTLGFDLFPEIGGAREGVRFMPDDEWAVRDLSKPTTPPTGGDTLVLTAVNRRPPHCSGHPELSTPATAARLQERRSNIVP